MKKIRIGVLGVAFLVLTGLTCIDCKKPAPELIKIGVVLPFTGPSANQGQDSKEGLELALEDLRQTPYFKGKKSDYSTRMTNPTRRTRLPRRKS